MTSQYRAGQRVALIISELQDQGLTTSEIALELQQRGVLMRGAAVAPVADLCNFVCDIVADFAEAIGKPATEAAALRARAEAAETALAAARAEVALARAEGEAAGRAARTLGDHDARNILRLCGDSIKSATITSPAGKAALARFESMPRVKVEGAFPRNTPARIDALVAVIEECHEIWSEWHDGPLTRAEAEAHVRGCGTAALATGGAR